MRRGLTPFTVFALVAGFLFLYLPIAIVVVYSFNDSTLVVAWGGWSLRWYRGLPANANLVDATLVSLAIAALSATAATVVGTLAAIVLTRVRRFRGRMTVASLVYAPLVMPDIIIGIALLLLFVAVDADRGMWTIAVAHTVLTMSFAAVVVQARLATFDTSLEEAAMDLGCPPLKTFLTVTLPLIWPALGAAWMLAFTQSLDEVVIANFVTGAGTRTLPIYIYDQAHTGVKPEINAVCTVWMIVVAIAVACASVLIRRSQAGQERTAALAAMPSS